MRWFELPQLLFAGVTGRRADSKSSVRKDAGSTPAAYRKDKG